MQAHNDDSARTLRRTSVVLSMRGAQCLLATFHRPLGSKNLES